MSTAVAAGGGAGVFGAVVVWRVRCVAGSVSRGPVLYTARRMPCPADPCAASSHPACRHTRPPCATNTPQSHSPPNVVRSIPHRTRLKEPQRREPVFFFFHHLHHTPAPLPSPFLSRPLTALLRTRPVL